MLTIALVLAMLHAASAAARSPPRHDSSHSPTRQIEIDPRTGAAPHRRCPPEISRGRWRGVAWPSLSWPTRQGAATAAPWGKLDQVSRVAAPSDRARPDLLPPLPWGKLPPVAWALALSIAPASELVARCWRNPLSTPPLPVAYVGSVAVLSQYRLLISGSEGEKEKRMR
jgi:hypothetical protein